MVKTPDGQHMFVMLGSRGFREAELAGEEDNHVPAGYRFSGLYGLEDDTTPLYTVDWYAHRVDLSTDGRYAIRHGPWASDTSDLACAFYDRGTLLAEYRVTDLVLFTLPWDHSVSHFQWRDESDFDAETNELSIRTKSWSSYRFDATNGEMMSSFRGDYLLVGGFALAGFTFVLAVYLRKRRRRQQR